MKATVFNAKNDGYLTKKYPLFLGQPLGLYDSINIAYPVLHEHYRTQFSLNWSDEEVNLESSRMDLMPHRSKPEEVDLMVKTLANLWELDSVASRSIIGLFGKFITNSELTALMTEWSRFETIHALTYSQIIRNCVPDPVKAVEEVIKNEKVLGRSDLIVEALDELQVAGDKYGLGLIKDGPELKKTIIKGLIVIYLLERVQFMSSFAVIFGMAETGRYIGIAKLVQLIARDELCMSGDHEVLTPKGWVPFTQLQDTDKVAQWDYDTRQMNFVVPEKVIRKKYSGKMIHIKAGKNRTVDQYVTEDHRIPVISPFTYEPKNKWVSAGEYTPSHTRSIPTAGYTNGISQEQTNNIKHNLTPLERLLIAFQADGSWNNSENRDGSVTGCYMLSFRFMKERKYLAMMDILKGLDYKYKKKRSENGYWSFHIWVPIDDMPADAKSFNWVDLERVSYVWCGSFLHEIALWDGHTRSQCSVVYINTNKQAIDTVQSIAHLSGCSTTIITTKAHKRVTANGDLINASECYRLSIHTNRMIANGQSILTEESEVEDLDVYCVRVPTSYFMVRRNGVVSITGNCHAQFTVDIINILRADPEWDAVYVDSMSDLEAIVDEVIEREFKWNEYLFSEGRQMVGLNKTLLNDFTLHSARDVTGFLGLRLNHPLVTKPPMKFFENWIEMDKTQSAPQEEDLTNYRSSNVTSDDEGEIFDI